MAMAPEASSSGDETASASMSSEEVTTMKKSSLLKATAMYDWTRPQRGERDRAGRCGR